MLNLQEILNNFKLATESYPITQSPTQKLTCFVQQVVVLMQKNPELVAQTNSGFNSLLASLSQNSKSYLN